MSSTLVKRLSESEAARLSGWTTLQFAFAPGMDAAERAKKIIAVNQYGAASRSHYHTGIGGLVGPEYAWLTVRTDRYDEVKAAVWASGLQSFEVVL